MNIKTIAPLAVAVVMGLLALVLAQRITSSKPQVVQSESDLARVVIAARGIAPGSEIEETDLREVEIASEALSGSTYLQAAQLLGRVAVLPIEAGSTITPTMLAPEGAEAGLVGLVPAGMRALTVEVNEISGVAGMLLPGNRVDILGRITRGQMSEQVTRTIVQNVPVLAVGQKLSAIEEKSGMPEDAKNEIARSVTLLVSPQQAELIDLAVSTSQVRLSLRNTADSAIAEVAGATPDDLLSGKGLASADQKPTNPLQALLDPFSNEITPANQGFAPSKRVRSVEVIRAGVSSEVNVEESGAADPDRFTGGSDLLLPGN